MTAEDREQNVGQNVGDKERAADDKDVEGHGFTPPARSDEGGEADEPDVEGHGFTPPAQADGV